MARGFIATRKLGIAVAGFPNLFIMPAPAQQAVVSVWRHPADSAVPPKLDPQGKSRIYLAEGVAKARAHALSPIPLYAASMRVEGKPCGG